MTKKAKAIRFGLDFYETPTRLNLGLSRCVVTPLLQRLTVARVWVDLGAGRGAIGRILRTWSGFRGIGVEFSAERAAEARASDAYVEVIEGDVSSLETRQAIQGAVSRHFGRDRPDLVIANPPFAIWEVFEETADWVGAEQTALLLPALAFEADRASKKPDIVRRARLLRSPFSGRYDLAKRATFIRAFREENGSITYEAAGQAQSAYAWRVKGVAHAGRYAWLEVPRVGGTS